MNAKKKNTYEVGDIIKVDDYEIIQASNIIVGCRALTESLAATLGKVQSSFWGLIKEKYPELDFDKYGMSYKHSANEIKIDRILE